MVLPVIYPLCQTSRMAHPCVQDCALLAVSHHPAELSIRAGKHQALSDCGTAGTTHVGSPRAGDIYGLLLAALATRVVRPLVASRTVAPSRHDAYAPDATAVWLSRQLALQAMIMTGTAP